MASTGPNTTQPLSSFICPSVTLSPSFVNLFLWHLTLNCQSMFIYPFVTVFSLPLALSLFFLSSETLLFLSVHSLPRFIYHSLSLPLSLPRSIPLSYPQQVQNNLSGVDQIFQAHMDRTDGHKSWVFWSAHPGFFKLCVVRKSSMELAYEILLLYLQFHAKSLAFL